MTKTDGVIRVLVVDDSVVARDLIRAILSSEPGIVVAGEAADGAEAVAKVVALRPDIATMDIEMPVLGGLDAIERIMTEHPLPILVVTAVAGVRTAFDAVSRGALDVIEKPEISLEHAANLIRRIRLLAGADVRPRTGSVARRTEGAAAPEKVLQRDTPNGEIVAIASSTGGPQAIYKTLAVLPATFPAPIVITQHIACGFTEGMAEWLNSGTPLEVMVARDNERLRAGAVYVNPAEHSMRISGRGMIVLGDCDGGKPYHPSCDTLLASVARSYRERAVGLIMSGMGDDGVSGMEAIRASGGVTLAQDEGSSVIFGMNRLAVERRCIDLVLPLSGIPAELMRRVGARQ